MMRRLLRPATALLAIAIAGSATVVPASAADETLVFTAIRWGGPIDKGNPLTVSTVKKRMVVSYGLQLTPTIFCSGDACDLARPGRIEVLRQGVWQPWVTGTLAQLADSSKVLTAKRTTTFLVRSVLPAYGDLPEVITGRWSVRFVPGTSVVISGSAVIPATPSNDYTWQFRPVPGTVTVAVTPAAAGRIVELRDAGVEGYPLLGKGTTDAKGRVTVTADFTGAAVLSVTVLPNRERAGWYIDALPVP